MFKDITSVYRDGTSANNRDEPLGDGQQNKLIDLLIMLEDTTSVYKDERHAKDSIIKIWIH
jgi:hypothetical protein